MKKLLAFLLLFAVLLTLAACSINTRPNGGDDGGKTPKKEKIKYSVIVTGNSSDIDTREILQAFFDKNGRPLRHVTDGNSKLENEIVFGEAERVIVDEARKAYEALVAEKKGEASDYVGYLVYKNGSGDVAYYWSHKYIEKAAIESFFTDYCDLDVIADADAGVVHSEILNVEEYIYENSWGKLEKEAPAEVVGALKRLAECYDGSAIVDWMANLWEPYICVCGRCEDKGETVACYGGGFYYANSARDHLGFLPDLESTRQLLGWLDANGAFEHYDGYADAISDVMKEKIIAFCQSCLDPDDGYFYHPQWGKGIGTERKGRDLTWGIGLLNDLGAKPQYPTASDRLAGKTAASLTAPLGRDAVATVSAVIATDAFEDSLKSKDTFIAWLKSVTKGDDMFINSAGAHTINAVQSQIIAAGYLGDLLDFLDERQEKLYSEMKAAQDADPENAPAPTGLWQRTIDYNAVWGLLKLAPFYNSGNREIKHAEEIMRTCVACILIDADEGGDYHANDLKNLWDSANMLLINAKKHNPDSLDGLYAITRENAAAMIDESIKKVMKFRQEDGSFGYDQGTSAPMTQGVPVSKGLAEGDVNATSLICTMYRCCFTVLGYDAVPLCDFRDGDRFLATVAALGSAEKLPKEKPDALDFNDGDISAVNTTLTNGVVEITDRPGGESCDLALKMTTTTSTVKGDTVQCAVSPMLGATCFILEFDLYFESAKDGNLMQIRIGESYMIEVVKSSAKIYLRSNPTTKNTKYTELLGANFSEGEWVNIRLEYYLDDEAPRTKVFFNGKYATTSDSFFTNTDSPEGVKPKNTYSVGNFFFLRAVTATAYLDNIFCYMSNAEYNDSTLPID